MSSMVPVGDWTTGDVSEFLRLNSMDSLVPNFRTYGGEQCCARERRMQRRRTSSAARG
jgi:hypothetical protein